MEKKLKRMIYVWEENLEFYDSLENKSDFINRKIAEAKRLEGHKDKRIDFVKNAVAKIDERNRAARG